MAIVLAIVVLIVIAAVVYFVLRSGSKARTEEVAEDAASFRLRPEVADFHVRDDSALVHFAVPVPEGEVDAVLSELLGHEAVEVVREKRHSLPIDQVTEVIAFGSRNGESVEVARIELETPGELPPPMPPAAVPRASKVDFDPLGAYSAEAPTAAPTVADTKPEGELQPIRGEIRLTGSVEAGLRAQGVDPGSMAAKDLAVGLLRLTGYSLSDAGKPDTYYAAKAGSRTFLRVVEHAEGSYPEVDSQTVNEFMVDFVSSGADRGLFLSDKFCPYEVYERERREPRVRFVTRERLQGFVDALTVS